jgi:hypothetical protein
VVHENKYNHESGVFNKQSGISYLRVELVDELDGSLQVTTMYGFSNLDPLLNTAEVDCGVNIGFGSKFLCS